MTRRSKTVNGSASTSPTHM